MGLRGGTDLELRCPLWVKSGHQGTFNPCPLYPQKRTLELSLEMSALCQKQTFCAALKNVGPPSRRRQPSLGAPVYAKLSKCGILLSICELIGPMSRPTLVGAKP